MITTDPPISASFMTTDLSFAKDFIAFLPAKNMLYLIFVLDLVVEGILQIFIILFCITVFGGIKLLLFLTIDMSVSSFPNKYSASRNFLLN